MRIIGHEDNTAVALIDPDGRVLLAQRPEGKSMAGLGEFPGGKVEAGETPEDALVRELHEELGIETWSSRLAPLTFASHTYRDFHLLMPLFARRKWDGIVQGKEGQKLAWVCNISINTRCLQRIFRSFRYCEIGYKKAPDRGFSI